MSEALPLPGRSCHITQPQTSPAPAFRIRRDVLEALDPLRRMAAYSAIQRGAWLLVNDNNQPIVAPSRAAESGELHGTPARS